MRKEGRKGPEFGQRLDALLILGPTGSGKTPLGNHLQTTGIDGRRCLHFDFGACLRNVLSDDSSPLTSEENAVVQKVVDTGALLENSQFPIAEKLLYQFYQQKDLLENDLLILNGLPRHTGQAEDLSSILNLRRVIFLECSLHTVFQRIRQNTGGDRAERLDDSLTSIERRMERFQERTQPLIDHYATQGSLIVRIPVKIETDPASIRREWLQNLPLST